MAVGTIIRIVKVLFVPIMMFATACTRHNELRQANEFLCQLEYARARTIVEQVVAVDSMNANALALLLRVYFLSRDTVAFDSLRNGLEATPSPVTRLALGEFYYHIGEFDKAVTQFALIGENQVHSNKAAEWLESTLKAKQAQQLIDYAIQLKIHGGFNAAIKFLNRADRIWKELNYVGGRVFALGERTRVSYILGDAAQIERDAKEGFLLSQNSGDRHVRARGFFDLAFFEDLSDNDSAANVHLNQAIEFAKIDRQRSINIELGAALISAKMQIDTNTKLDSLEKIFLSIIELCKRFHQDQPLNTGWYELGVFYTNIHKYAKAQKCYEESFALAILRNDEWVQVGTLGGLGDLYSRMNKYQEAEKVLQESITRYLRMGAKASAVGDKISLADLYSRLGRNDDALNVAFDALSGAQEVHSERLAEPALFYIAQSYQAKGLWLQAIEYYEKALASARKLRIHNDITISAGALVECNIALGRVPSSTAMKELDTLIVSTEKHDNVYSAAWLRISRGAIFAEKKEFSRAIDEFNRAAVIGDSLQDYELVLYAYYSLGEAYKKWGRKQEALAAYRRTEDAFKNLIGGVDIYESRLALFDKIRTALERQIELSFDPNLKTNSMIFELVERAKTRAFYSILPDSDGSSTSVLSKPYETVDIQRIQKLIPADALLLQYVVLEGSTLVCVVNTEGWLRIFSIPYLRKELRTEVEKLIQEMQKEKLSHNFWRSRATHLGSVLLDSLNVNGLLNNINTLIVLPDDCLRDLPFQVLLLNNQFVVERFSVVNYPSASVMKKLYMDRPTQLQHGALAIAYAGDGSDSLQFADDEVRMIRKNVGVYSQVFTGIAATKDTLKKIGTRFDILHIVGHGIESPYNFNPSLFSIQLAPQQPRDDGKLFARDVFNMNFRIKHPLVVLNGCETGIGRRTQAGFSPGGEVTSLVHTFLYAGARSVVSTLWEIDDQASVEFMQFFYQELKNATPIPRALQKAQQAMIVHSQYSHPFYWAAYTVVGT